VHQRGPAQETSVRVLWVRHCRLELAQQVAGGICHLLGLAQIDAVTTHEGADRRVAQVMVVVTAKQVIQHAETQGPLGEQHVLELELLEHSAHDGKSAQDHWQAVALEACEVDRIEATCAQEHGLELLEAVASNPPRREAVLLQDLNQRLCGTA